MLGWDKIMDGTSLLVFKWISDTSLQVAGSSTNRLVRRKEALRTFASPVSTDSAVAASDGAAQLDGCLKRFVLGARVRAGISQVCRRFGLVHRDWLAHNYNRQHETF